MSMRYTWEMSGRGVVTPDAAAVGDLGGLLAARARNGPHPVAVVEGASGRQLSWAEVAGAVVGWQGLAEHLGRSARVGLLCADPLATASGVLAALAAGVLVAPLDPGASPAELTATAQRLGLSAVVADDERADLARIALGRWSILTPQGPSLDGLATDGPATDGPATDGPATDGPAPGDVGPEAAESSASLLLASSGTTGTPKLIPLGAAQVLRTARAVADSHQLDQRDVGYSPLPLFHINGLVVGVVTTAVTGGRLVVDRRFSASRFWATVEAQGVTWLNLVPAVISVLCERPAPPPEVARRISFARSASAPLAAPTRERFEEHVGVAVLETYGMTEAASQIAANPRDPAARRPGSVGLPVDVEVRVVDRAGRRSAAGVVGQVEISGDRVVDHYWSPGPPGTAGHPARHDSGWLATGDLGSLDDDGYLYLAGRVDDVINRGGEKVFPHEVEEVLLADPAVAAAAVVGRPHPVMGEEPVAFVLATPGSDADPGALAEDLGALCRNELSRYKRPAEIIVADELPSGPTGKVRHAALRASLAAGAAPARILSAPSAPPPSPAPPQPPEEHRGHHRPRPA